MSFKERKTYWSYSDYLQKSKVTEAIKVTNIRF